MSPQHRQHPRTAQRIGVAGLLLALMHMLTSGFACSSLDSAQKPAGEPCTRSSECESELACIAGRCREAADASVDAGPLGDGGTDAR